MLLNDKELKPYNLSLSKVEQHSVSCIFGHFFISCPVQKHITVILKELLFENLKGLGKWEVEKKK